MAIVKYILEDNSEVIIEADIGQNLMQLDEINKFDGNLKSLVSHLN